MKPQMDLVKIIILSMYHVIVRPTKIIKDLHKDFKTLIFKVIFQCWKLVEFFQKKFFQKNFLWRILD